MGPIKKDSRPLDLSQVHGEGFRGPEVIGIEVSNVGKLKVRVTGYGVALRKGGLSFNPLGDAIGPKLPHWLEPGDTETWYATVQDAKDLMSSVRAINRPAAGVYMKVKLGTGEERSTRRTVNF